MSRNGSLLNASPLDVVFANSSVPPSSANLSSASPPLTSQATVIAVSYILIGLVFIFLQLVCAYLTAVDKEMQNPTYKFVINQSIADSLELIAIAVYSGITILIGGYQHPGVHRFMSFLCLSAWYANGILFVFIAFSRWISITRTHLVGEIFRPSIMKLLHIVSWFPITLLVLYGTVVHESSALLYFPRDFTWGFDLESNIGNVWHWVDLGFNTIMATTEMSLNVMSLVWLHQRRKQVKTLLASENRRRETKLLLQCFIVGCMFTGTDVMFTLVNIFEWNSVAAFLLSHVIWLCNHCINPIVYLSFNWRLRHSFLKFVTLGRYGKPMVVPVVRIDTTTVG